MRTGLRSGLDRVRVKSPKSLIIVPPGPPSVVVSGGISNPLEFRFENDLTNTGTDAEKLFSNTFSNTNVSFSSSVFKQGTHSASFNGTSSALSIPTGSNDVFNLGRKDFTFEFYARFNDFTGIHAPFSKWSGAQGTGYLPIITQTLLQWNRNGAGFNSPFPASLSINTWYHFALVRRATSLSSNTLTFFLDGTSFNSVTENQTYNDVQTPFVIGKNSDNAQFFNGFIDTFRFYEGAKYTANFTPS